jgi:hypothetical protein
MTKKKMIKIVDKESKEILYCIEFCKFKRSKNSNWEWGILLNHGSFKIIDKHGRKPNTVWDFEIGMSNVSVKFALWRDVFRIPLRMKAS